jgi:hypothetical protein
MALSLVCFFKTTVQLTVSSENITRLDLLETDKKKITYGLAVEYVKTNPMQTLFDPLELAMRVSYK